MLSSNQISEGLAATSWKSVQAWIVSRRETLFASGTMPPVWVGVEGFRNGFTVHDELLGVPQRDKIVCIPGGATSIQIVRVIKKYLGDNPDKASRHSIGRLSGVGKHVQLQSTEEL